MKQRIATSAVTTVVTTGFKHPLTPFKGGLILFMAPAATFSAGQVGAVGRRGRFIMDIIL